MASVNTPTLSPKLRERELPFGAVRLHRLARAALLGFFWAGVLFAAVYAATAVTPITIGTAEQRAATAEVVQFLERRGADLPPTLVIWNCPLTHQRESETLMGEHFQGIIHVVFICTHTPTRDDYSHQLVVAHEFGHVVSESAPQELRDVAVRLGFAPEWDTYMMEWVAEHFRYSFETNQGYKWAGLFIDP